jgi:TRAP-type C4-dicarboxylate transport system, periplasmic component
MRKATIRLLAVLAAALSSAAAAWSADKVTLRYAHMNSADSIPGKQALYFADRVRELSGGSVVVEVYPDSRLGSLQEQAEQVSSGVIAFHHNTAAGIGYLYRDFAVLDTPYIYRDVDHLLAVTAPNSEVMAKLGAGLLRARGLRVLYTFYFGARDLSCDRPIRKPADLASLRIRSIPFPIYQAAVEGLGGIPTPIDWAQTPTALAAKVVNGQENPVNILLSSKLYENQPYLMLTHHILAADIVVANDAIWQKLSRSQREAISRAAALAAAYATKLTRESEAQDLAELKRRGMKVIGPAEGLDLGSFRERTTKLVQSRFGPEWGEYYSLIERTK